MVGNPKDFISSLAVFSDVPTGFRDFPVQQNGIDLRIREICEVGRDVFVLHTPAVGAELHNGGFEKLVRKVHLTRGGYFRLKKGRAYNIASHIYIREPIYDHVAYVVGRSTLGRAGLLVRSSLYDSGYRGRVGAMLFAFTDALISQYSRFAQIVFCTAQANSKYDGQYNEEMGGRSDS